MSEQRDTIIISSCTVPVQIFIVFLVQKEQALSVDDVRERLLIEYKIELTWSRVNQVLNSLVESKNLEKKFDTKGTKKKQTAYYIFKQLI